MGYVDHRVCVWSGVLAREVDVKITKMRVQKEEKDGKTVSLAKLKIENVLAVFCVVIL